MSISSHEIKGYTVILIPAKSGTTLIHSFIHTGFMHEDAKNLGKKVGVYPIDDNDWNDVGQWAEYKHMVEKML